MNYSTDRMLSGILHSPGQFEVESCDVPNPQPGELLIRVFACAICGSDLRIMSNGSPRIKSPRIIGHEVAGEVVEVGKGVNSYTIGDKVSLGADIPCGECDFCRSGMSNCCQINYAIGYQFDGGFAEPPPGCNKYSLPDPSLCKIKSFTPLSSSVGSNITAPQPSPKIMQVVRSS